MLAHSELKPQKNTLQEKLTQETLVAISINGQKPAPISFLIHINSRGIILLRRRDLKQLQLTVPGQGDPETYLPLDELPATRYRLDTKTLTLFIETDRKNFQPQYLNARPKRQWIPQKPPLGGYLNYDFTSHHYHNEATLGAFLEAGIFKDGWNGTTGVVNRDLDGNSRFIRQMSTATLDLPEQRSSLRVGDAINHNGAWGRPVRFGGLQWATNFATQPDFISFPLPSLSSSAALPSTAEVFINNVRTFESEVTPGPFTINELPVITGSGEVQMVIQDPLGREQKITQSFYASQRLLKPGIKDFSFEIGSFRENFGEKSNDYSKWMASATQRRGLTNTLTAEWHGELTNNHQTMGLAATTLLSKFGEFTSAIAGSHGEQGNGGLFSIGLERKTPTFGFGLQTRLTSPDFDQLGRLHERRLARQQTQAHIGWNNQALGSFGMGFVHLNNRDEPDNKLITANYSRSLPANWSMGISAFQNLEHPRDYAFTLTLTHALGPRRATSLSTTRHKDGADTQLLQFQQNLPAGEGVGYRLVAGSEESDRIEGRLDAQNDTGTYALEASRVRGADAYRASAAGSVAFFEGGPYLSRKLGNSFAVVDVNRYPNVRVYAENQLVARTNAHGLALVPDLRPYQQNQLRIEQLDIPLNAQVEQLDMNVVPYHGSGYNVAFPVKRSHSAELRIVLENGNPIETGSTVQLDGVPDSFPVALNGKVFLQGLNNNNRIRVIRPHKQQCGFQLSFNPTDDPLPQLGTFICRDYKAH
jgi:outer membrane usher protein